MSDLIQPAIGAIVGFLLALLGQFAVLIARWICRPKLLVETIGQNHTLLSHSEEVEPGVFAAINHYGFNVRNAGRSIAIGVRAQVTRIETRARGASEFSVFADSAFDLLSWRGAEHSLGSREVTIVPKVAVPVGLAFWSEETDVVFPAIGTRLDYYEEHCFGAQEYRFTVVAFAENARHVIETLTISAPGVRR